MSNDMSGLTLSQTRLLATVIKTTRNMLDLADEEKWDAVASLEVLRREDLKRCFEIPLEEGQSELVAEALAVLLHLNEELASKLVHARKQSLAESLDSTKNRDAINEYRDTQFCG